MVRKDHYDQINNSNNQYAKLKIMFREHPKVCVNLQTDVR